MKTLKMKTLKMKTLKIIHLSNSSAPGYIIALELLVELRKIYLHV